DRARVEQRVVALVAVDPARVAGLSIRTHCQRVAGDRHTIAEVIEGPRVRRLEVRLLGPRRSGPGEYIGGAAVLCGVVALVSVRAGGAAVLARRSNDEGVARQRD